jgi:hypothetical protein
MVELDLTEFTMGCPASDDFDAPCLPDAEATTPHIVSFTYDIEMMQNEVFGLDWSFLMGTCPAESARLYAGHFTSSIGTMPLPTPTQRLSSV